MVVSVLHFRIFVEHGCTRTCVIQQQTGTANTYNFTDDIFTVDLTMNIVKMLCLRKFAVYHHHQERVENKGQFE